MAYETIKHRLESTHKPYKRYKNLKRNTLKIWYEDGDIAIRYHHTDIITYKPNGDTVYTTGGWHTTSTFNRLNEYSPLHFFRNGWVWYFSDQYSICNPHHPSVNRFRDGMIIKR